MAKTGLTRGVSIERTTDFAAAASLHERTPGGIAAVVGSGDQELGMAENVGHVELRAAGASGVAEEHEIEAVRGEGGPLVVKAFDQDPLARAVRLHHADAERSGLDAGEGDEIAARRPDRRRVMAFAKGNTPGRAAARAHHIDLLRAAAVGFKCELGAVR